MFKNKVIVVYQMMEIYLCSPIEMNNLNFLDWFDINDAIIVRMTAMNI